MVWKNDVAVARQRLVRCEQIIADLEILEAAAGAQAVSKPSFKGWNTGAEIIPTELLKEVIAAGVDVLIDRRNRELESINLTEADKGSQS